MSLRPFTEKELEDSAKEKRCCAFAIWLAIKEGKIKHSDSADFMDAILKFVFKNWPTIKALNIDGKLIGQQLAAYLRSHFYIDGSSIYFNVSVSYCRIIKELKTTDLFDISGN